MAFRWPLIMLMLSKLSATFYIYCLPVATNLVWKEVAKASKVAWSPRLTSGLNTNQQQLEHQRKQADCQEIHLIEFLLFISRPPVCAVVATSRFCFGVKRRQYKPSIEQFCLVGSWNQPTALFFQIFFWQSARLLLKLLQLIRSNQVFLLIWVQEYILSSRYLLKCFHQLAF